MTPKTWAKASPLIQATLEKDNHPETLQDVCNMLMSQEAHLWFSGRAVAVTLVDDEDLRVWLWGGDIRDLPKLGVSLIEWGRVVGFKSVVVSPFRKAWRRLLKRFGAEILPNGDIILKLES